jgi:DNA-binding Lrp family transcriptional regulator
MKQFASIRDIQKRAESDFDQVQGLSNNSSQDNSALFQFDVEEEPIEEEDDENYDLISLGESLKSYFQTNYVGIQNIRHFLIDLNKEHYGVEHLQINLKEYLADLPDGTEIGINEKISIDKIFKSFMVALQVNGRLSLSKISEHVNITDRALDYRKKQLISTKILKRLSLMINASQLNLEHIATLEVTFDQVRGFVSLEDNLAEQLNVLNKDDRVTIIGVSPKNSLIIIGFFKERADILDFVTEIENIQSVERVEHFHFSDFAKGKEFLLPNLNYLLAEK